MKLATISLLSLALAYALCFAALRVAEAIAKHQIQQQEQIQP